MANIWAIKSGDWSDPTVWNTGVLPTSADDVYANNFNVNVNQSIEVNSLRNNTNTGITAGGTYNFNTSNITANILSNLFYGAATFITVTANSGTVTISINNVITAPNFYLIRVINHSGNCNLSINAISMVNSNNVGNTAMITKTSTGLLQISADILGGHNLAGQGNGTATMILNSNSDTIINGRVIGGTNIGDISRAIILNAGNLTINGDVLGGTGALSASATIHSVSSGIVQIVGNVIGNVSRALLLTAGQCNVTGSVTGGNSAGVPTVEVQGSAVFNQVGVVQASAQASAIVCNSPISAMVIATGPFLKNGYVVAIASQTLSINFNSNSYFQFRKSNGEDIDYVSTIEGYNYPTATDVRDGVVYKSGLVTGTLKVPNPADVRKSIPTDNTVGTADITPEDFITALENSTSDIAVRLRNCATVESTGAQIASYE